MTAYRIIMCIITTKKSVVEMLILGFNNVTARFSHCVFVQQTHAWVLPAATLRIKLITIF